MPLPAFENNSIGEVRQFAKEKKIPSAIGFVKSPKQDGWAAKTLQAYGVKTVCRRDVSTVAAVSRPQTSRQVSVPAVWRPQLQL